MTALTEFQRLESPGSWRTGPAARLREVVVSVGDATLILSDPKSDTPLAHWSLPAVRRLNPGHQPALFAPDADGEREQLEIDDPLMIEAIHRVQSAIAARHAHPGRLRRGLLAAAVLAMLAFAVLWLPGATIRYSARVAQPAQADAVGHQVLADIERSTGPACQRGSATTILARLLPEGQHAHVLPADLGRVIALPGNHLVIGRDLIEDHPGPGVLAGHLLAATLREGSPSRLRDALRHAGFVASLKLLTDGKLPPDSLQGYGEVLLSRAEKPLPAADLQRAFREAHLDIGPYARSLGAEDQQNLAAQQADAVASSPVRRALDDQQWLALQQVCK